MRLNQLRRVVVHVSSFRPPRALPEGASAQQRQQAYDEHDAYMRSCVSALEFARRVKERKAVASNPGCEVEVKHRSDDFRPTVFVQYENGEKLIMHTEKMKAEEIVTKITEYAKQLRLAASLTKDGIPKLVARIPASYKKQILTLDEMRDKRS